MSTPSHALQASRPLVLSAAALLGVLAAGCGAAPSQQGISQAAYPRDPGPDACATCASPPPPTWGDIVRADQKAHDKFRSARVNRNVGIVASSVSGAAFLAGAAVFGTSGAIGAGVTSAGDAALPGLVVGIMGLATLPVGLAISIVSSREMKRIEKDHPEREPFQSVRLVLAPGAITLTGGL